LKEGRMAGGMEVIPIGISEKEKGEK